MKKNGKSRTESNGNGDDEERHVEPNPIFSVGIDDQNNGDVGAINPERAHERSVEVLCAAEVDVVVLLCSVVSAVTYLKGHC